MNPGRRVFILRSVTACGAAVSASAAWSQTATPEMVKETDGPAQAVGFVSDATTVDKRKHPTYAAGQRCGACVLFDGKPADRSAACPLFPGKHVPAAGWCSSWARKV